MTLTDRQNRIALLLRSLDWYDLQPKSWTPELVRRQSKPGDGPSHRIECPACGGLKLRRIRGVLRPCEGCGGSIEADRPGCGWVAVDDYTERRIGDVRTHLETGRREIPCDVAGCDRGTVRTGPWRGDNDRCLHCDGRGKVEVTESQWRSARTGPGRMSAEVQWGGGGDPAAAAIDKRDAAGSYWQVGLALATLRLDLPRAYRTVARVYVEGSMEVDELSDPGRLAHDVGLAYLDRLLADVVLRVPNGIRAAERRRRDALKRRRRQEQAA